jgi:Skp family chaperone for outer membrane proteins
MTGIEAIGDAATGALVGRAVEPEAGESAGHTHETRCLNCGCDLIGDYCHCCGQQAHVHRTVGAFWHDLLHGVLHFEGKIWRTLPMLALRPGELTRRYIAGERAKFVSPLALFLFSVFLMFAVFHAVGGPVNLSSSAAADQAEAVGDLVAAQRDAQSDIAELQADIEKAKAEGQPTAPLEARIQARRERLKAKEQAAARDIEEARQEAAKEAKYEASGEIEPFKVTARTGWPALDHAIQKVAKNPSLMVYKVQTNAYKFSWALIPISLPFLWLLFLHRRRYRRDYGAYDHLIFITYSIAFMSLGAIVLALLRPIGVADATIALAVFFIPPIHIFRQLRGAYGLSRWSAAWRTFLLLIFAFVALSLFVTLLLMLGAFG